MSNPQQWMYLDAAGNQCGPLPAEQLQQLASTGQITPDTQVWTEGLENWVPANQVEGLIPPQPAAPVHQPQINLGPQSTTNTTATPVNPYTSPAATAVTAPQEGGSYPIPDIKRINFGLYISSLLGSIILVIIGFVSISASTKTHAQKLAEDPNYQGAFETPVFGILLLILGCAIALIPGIIQLIAIYRAWTILQPGGGTVSPGQAVGFLFIPLFGPIWMIIILCKLPGEWNSIVSRYQNTSAAPRLSIGIAICIILIPLIGNILWINEVSKAINFMVSARLMPTQQTSNPAGMRLY